MTHDTLTTAQIAQRAVYRNAIADARFSVAFYRERYNAVHRYRYQIGHAAYRAACSEYARALYGALRARNVPVWLCRKLSVMG